MGFIRLTAGRRIGALCAVGMLVGGAACAIDVTGTVSPPRRSIRACKHTRFAYATCAMLPDVARTIAALPASVTKARATALDALAARIGEHLAQRGEVTLLFICTHNSRRSHLAQVWAAAAAHHVGVAHVRSLSGGTEATACNPRTIAALERAGFEVTDAGPPENPRYAVAFSADAPAVVCFSKTFDGPDQPRRGAIAVMTCSHADDACPIVPGAADRVSLPYEDPKCADDAADESAVYDARSTEIATEMLYLFRAVAQRARV